MTETTGTAGALPAGTPPEIADLGNMVLGAARLQVLHAVAVLHIADYLAGGALTAEEVADRAGSDPRATFRLMRAAASLGVLSSEGGRRFGLTGMGHLLRDGVPGSFRAFTLVQAGHAHWQAWGLFPESVRLGASQAKQALGADIFDYYARPDHAEEAALFAASMAELSTLTVQGAVAALDVSGLSNVVDVGGADGQFVLELITAHPQLRGQVLDLPHAVARAREEAARRGLSDRFSAVAGDFFNAVPGADLYLLKMVLHDWDDDRAGIILRNCRAAAPDGGRALVVEAVIGASGQPDPAVLSDMTMLCAAAGMERDLGEFDALFAASGWRRDQTYLVGPGYYALELAVT
ncbi:MAG TPA: methyltransferase [Trebonia sp.]|nr:methyltransferase [Trebonia sp.]